MKIHSYNEENGSLIVSFATNESNGTPDDYTPVAFQPNVLNGSDSAEQEINQIAQRGLWIALEQNQKEQTGIDQAKIAYYMSLVGQTLEFNLSNISDTNVSDFTNVFVP